MSDTDVKTLIEDIGNLGKTMHDYQDRLETVEKRKPEELINDDILQKIADDIISKSKLLQEAELHLKRMDELEQKFELARQAGEKKEDGPTKIRLALKDFFSKGGELTGLSPETKEFMASNEYKTLTEGTDTAGGLFVDPEIEAEILKNIVDIDPVRGIARVRTLSSSNSVKGYRRIETPTAYWETELGTSTASESQWAGYEVVAFPLTGKTPVSGDLLDDVRYVEAEVTADISEQFAYTEGLAFISGNGVDRPMGIVTNAGTDDAIYPAVVTSAGAAGTDAVQADDFAKMFTTLKAPYRGNSTWMLNSNTFRSVLILKDANNQYLWNPGLQSGPPTQLYGRPYVIAESIADEGSDTYPLYFGDFRRGYMVVDRSGMVIQRDPYTTWPAVYFKFRKRVGGQVVKAEAIKILKTS